RARAIPLVAWVQDVYPEIAIAFGVLREGQAAARALAAAARWGHRLARLSVVLSDGMADRVAAQGQDRARIRVIPNWAAGAARAPGREPVGRRRSPRLAAPRPRRTAGAEQALRRARRRPPAAVRRPRAMRARHGDPPRAGRLAAAALGRGWRHRRAVPSRRR